MTSRAGPFAGADATVAGAHDRGARAAPAGRRARLRDRRGRSTAGPCRTLLLATTLLLPAGAGHAPAAAADIPGNSRTEAVVTPGPAQFEGVLERRGDSDWYRVTLKAGRNYGFQVYSGGCTRMSLRDTAGKVLRSDLGWDDKRGGFEFRSATTKTYFLEYRDANFSPCIDPVEGGYPTGYSGNVEAEVRGDITTRATIAVGQTLRSRLNWYFDQDYFRATLDAGKRYTVTVNGAITAVRVADPSGNIVADPPVGFTVPKRGTYYVVVIGTGYDALPYAVSLSTP
jgi:hypothetical protein